VEQVHGTRRLHLSQRSVRDIYYRHRTTAWIVLAL